MGRREFITLLGSAAAAWPLTLRAQQSDRMRRIGVLLPDSENNPEVQARLAALKPRLQDLGWTNGRNVRFDYRFTGGNDERIRIGAGELVAIAPDVILVYSGPALAALQQATRTIPIVFAQVANPVAILNPATLGSIARNGHRVLLRIGSAGASSFR
jgi:putative tryptophan/tyrosine transport system substrate-binding protein